MMAIWIDSEWPFSWIAGSARISHFCLDEHSKTMQ